MRIHRLSLQSSQMALIILKEEPSETSSLEDQKSVKLVSEGIQRWKLRGEDAVYLRDLETFATVVG